MGVIEFIELSTQDGQVLDHFGLTNAVSPIWPFQCGPSNVGLPIWTLQLGPAGLARLMRAF
jgi:hypothetical protein